MLKKLLHLVLFLKLFIYTFDRISAIVHVWRFRTV